VNAAGRETVPDQSVMDVVKGLEGWNDMSSYQTYLQRFAAVYFNAVAVMSEHLRLDDRPAAISLAHKLAGVAANMALPHTFACAAEVERVLRAQLDPTLPLAQLDTAMELALVAIERLARS
jgi:HPt (histidine-containing phosphotransfer) domain-containing protein